MKTCLIISGGDFHPFAREDAQLVLACDKGYEYALRCGVIPDLLLSDFDSYGGTVSPQVPVQSFPSEKDDTDTMLAIRYALEQGCDRIRLVCALGGRLDHTLANLQSAVFAQERGVQVHIQSPDTEIFTLASGELRLPRREDWSLSLFAADRCEGLSIRGAKYELEDAVLTSGFPLGVSNAWAEPEATISVERGVLLIILCKM